MYLEKCCCEQAEKNVRDIKCITGLKGFGCIMVVLIHFCAAFFPCLYMGNTELKRLPFEQFINHSPLYIIYNGSFAVYIFWTVSAFLISVHWFGGCGINKIAEKIIKKYVRFLAPVFITCLFSYVLMKRKLFFNIPVSVVTKSEWLAIFFGAEPNLRSFLKCVFWDTFFSGNILLYDPVLWSMKVEFLGSLFTCCFLVLYGNIRRRNFLLAVVFIFFCMTNPQYICFVIGILCGNFYIRSKERMEKWAYVVCCIGVIGGGYPAGYYPETGMYAWIPIKLFGKWDTRTILYCIAAGCILMAVIYCKWLNRISLITGLIKLGDISLYIYLLHLPMECSVGCFTFMRLFEWSGNYLLATGIAFAVWLSCSIIVAYCFKRIIEPFWDKAVNGIVSFLLKDNCS